MLICIVKRTLIKDQSSTLGIELDIINTWVLSPTSVLLFDLYKRFLAFYSVDLSVHQSFKGPIRDLVTGLRVEHTMLEFRGC